MMRDEAMTGWGRLWWFWWWWCDYDDDEERNNNIDKAGGNFNINNDAVVNLAVISASLDGMCKT